MTLEELGWNPSRAADFETALSSIRTTVRTAARRLEPARIAVHHKNSYLVYAAGRELSATARGRLRAERPVTGDWVAIAPGGDGDAVIEAVLPRTGCFSRKEAGHGIQAQIIAANIDLVWVVTSAHHDYNLRRIERYLTLAWESGAQPSLLVTKVDLVPLTDVMRREIASCAPGVAVHGVSNVTGEGLDALRHDLAPGRTIALLGSSGVGKSTLVNRILGEERQGVSETRADGKGRHRTTRRELVLLPGGGILLDTPGMREMALWDSEEGLVAAFEEIDALAPGCRFGDCRHRGEPGCAVSAAVERGEISAERFAGYRKLTMERDALEQKRTIARYRRPK